MNPHSTSSLEQPPLPHNHARYDALNRPLGMTYSNGDPAITYNYDEANCLGLAVCQNIGHRTSMIDAAGSEAWSFQVDKTNSRSLHVNQRTNNSSPSNITKTTTYFLDLAGNITSIVYPTGRTVNYTFDAANRSATAKDSANGVTYATAMQTPPSGCLAGAVCYTPQGGVYSASIGQTSSFTGLDLNDTYNSRLQPLELKASSTSGNAMDITYNFVDPVSGKNAGHVYGMTNNLNSSRSQNFTYDQLNRITSAGTSATTGTTCWGYQYSYDAWANLLSQAAWTPNYNGCSENTLAGVTADGNNHISGLTYDPSGNTLSDGQNTYTWDAESQLKTAAGVTYAYDGDGRRVSKSNGKLYWYGSGGEILAETDANGNTLNEYVFFGGKRIAQIVAGGSTASIPIQNASFETTNPLTISCGTGCAYNQGPIPSWTLSGTNGGSFQPNSARFNLPLPDGSIIGWVQAGTISQTLTGTSLQPNSTYTLSVAVGHRIDCCTAAYSISLQAGSTVLAAVNGQSSSIPSGTFLTQTLTYTSGASVPSGDLTIVLGSTGNQGDFDNVRLSVTGSSTTVLYYAEDFLGSSRVMVTSTGVVCYDADFTPFGGERTITNTCPQNNYKFEGKERDVETGNDDFGARYYSNRLGRWLSSDWSAVPVPVPYANLTNPQTLNLYAMVADDPESFADLDGHNWFTDFFKYVWERNLNQWKYGEGVTNAELSAAFARERKWLIQNVAHNSDEANALAAASNSQINGLFRKWDAAIMAANGGEVIYGAYQYKRAANGSLVFYRGGGSLEAGPNDVKLDPEGMVKTTHGPSLNTDPAKLERFGEVYEIKLIPPELQIIQRGMNASHYEIVPRQPMTLERFQQLLRSVVTKLVETPEE